MSILEKLKKRVDRLHQDQAKALQHLYIATSLFQLGMTTRSRHSYGRLLTNLAISEARSSVLGTAVCLYKKNTCSVPAIKKFILDNKVTLSTSLSQSYLNYEKGPDCLDGCDDQALRLFKIRDKAVAHFERDADLDMVIVPDFDFRDTKELLMAINKFANLVSTSFFETEMHPQIIGLGGTEATLLEIIELTCTLIWTQQLANRDTATQDYDAIDFRENQFAPIRAELKKILKEGGIIPIDESGNI